jgi:hypothetical protein
MCHCVLIGFHFIISRTVVNKKCYLFINLKKFSVPRCSCLVNSSDWAGLHGGKFIGKNSRNRGECRREEVFC